MTFLEAAQRILDLADEPLHYRVITRRALEAELLETEGRTPEATMAAQLSTVVKDEAGSFVRVGPGVYGLRAWIGEGRHGLIEYKPTGRSLTPQFPSYDEVRRLLPVWVGLDAGAIPRLISEIWEFTGTPQANEDWSRPDEWIPQRLSGESRHLAERIWVGTGHRVNPRYCSGHWYLCRKHQLLEEDGSGKLALSEAGRSFARGPGADIERLMDEWEGLNFLLSRFGAVGTAAPGDLLLPWMAFLAQECRIASETTGRFYLADRLRNLVERGLVRKLERSYEITATGLAHIEKREMVSAAPSPFPGPPAEDAATQIRRILSEERDRTRSQLREILHQMDPYAFEQLIQVLLEAMGYTDVEVTKQSNDKGVDVKARFEFGITSVNEVIQAKRTRSNVHRPVLDQLRGSLHRFGAVRGTIITTAAFAKGAKDAAFEVGAAPITLIDGEKLVDLLIENKIGIESKKFELVSLDRKTFSRGEPISLETFRREKLLKYPPAE